MADYHMDPTANLQLNHLEHNPGQKKPTQGAAL